jgi:hypothetical protein
LVFPGLLPMIYRIRGEHTNHYTTQMWFRVWTLTLFSITHLDAFLNLYLKSFFLYTMKSLFKQKCVTVICTSHMCKSNMQALECIFEKCIFFQYYILKVTVSWFICNFLNFVYFFYKSWILFFNIYYIYVFCEKNFWLAYTVY